MCHQAAAARREKERLRAEKVEIAATVEATRAATAAEEASVESGIRRRAAEEAALFAHAHGMETAPPRSVDEWGALLAAREAAERAPSEIEAVSAT